jgi:hypothetical protein
MLTLAQMQEEALRIEKLKTGGSQTLASSSYKMKGGVQ